MSVSVELNIYEMQIRFEAGNKYFIGITRNNIDKNKTLMRIFNRYLNAPKPEKKRRRKFQISINKYGTVMCNQIKHKK